MKTYNLTGSAVFSTSAILFVSYLVKDPKSWGLTIFTILFIAGAVFHLKAYFKS